MSKTFAEAFGIQQIHEDYGKQNDGKTPPLKAYPKAYADMIRAIRGMDAMFGNFKRDKAFIDKLVEKEKATGKDLYPAQLYVKENLPESVRKKRKQGLSAVYLLPDALRESAPNGKTVFQLLKEAAAEKGISEDELFDDLK